MKYTVIKALQVPTGTFVKISKDQATLRAALMRPAKSGQHEALQPVWFKAGETLELENPAKHLIESLQPMGSGRVAKEHVNADSTEPVEVKAQGMA